MIDMAMFPEYNQEYHGTLPLWKEWLVRLFGERFGYPGGLLAYKYRGKFYVVK